MTEPWPWWWQDARQMDALGIPPQTAAWLCGVSRQAYKNAVEPHYREYNKRRCRLHGRKRPRKNRSGDLARIQRQRILGKARREAKDTKRHIDDILTLWGEPPRRKWEG